MSWIENPRLFLEMKANRAEDSSRSLVFNCAGVLDSRSDGKLLNKVNVELPIMLQEVCSDTHMSLVTFGTIMENYPMYCESNPYLYSKLLWNRQIRTSESNLHFQLHTLYGGKIQPHMFLGQIYESLNKNKTLAMSDGRQLREYHHIDETAEIISLFISQESYGIKQISSGQPLRLGELATKLYEHFGKSDLLKIASFKSHNLENVNDTYEPDVLIKKFLFRDSFNGIVQWYSELGIKDEK